ncbi:MAG: ATP-binding cassette domain-containing protein, partial [Salinivirgaceae bacterium]|nr:ATP-binding cassette domain-containing protein [Salinivirgaceae bacterium]
MISISDIHKSYGEVEVLKGINLEVAKGEIVSIVGKSGAGKTTLLQIVGTLLRPDSGRVTIGGVEVTSLSEKELSKFRNR